MNTEFPRITTRGNYDLWTGKRIKTGYRLYPKYKFDPILNNSKEVVIFVHGMRNTRYGAQMGGKILRRKLRQLGFKKHPVVSFSYDADIRGAHVYSDYDRVIRVAERIAKANGKHLSDFVNDLRRSNPRIKIHLVGHSLGCEVIDSYLRKFNMHTDSVHYFGSPVEVEDVLNTVFVEPVTKLVNYYNPKDDVIKQEADAGRLEYPSCLHKVGEHFNPISNLKDVRCLAKDHRFKSYVEKLRRFP